VSFVCLARGASESDALPISNSGGGIRKRTERTVGTSQPKLGVASRSEHFATRMSSKTRDYISDDSEDWEDMNGPPPEVPRRSVSSSVAEGSVEVSDEDTLIENPAGLRVDALTEAPVSAFLLLLT